VGAEALALLDSGRTLPAEAVLVSLVNDLDELARPTVRALDDFHAIDAPDIHESVTFLLDLASLISWHHRQVFKGAA